MSGVIWVARVEHRPRRNQARRVRTRPIIVVGRQPIHGTVEPLTELLPRGSIPVSNVVYDARPHRREVTARYQHWRKRTVPVWIEGNDRPATSPDRLFRKLSRPRWVALSAADTRDQPNCSRSHECNS